MLRQDSWHSASRNSHFLSCRVFSPWSSSGHIHQEAFLFQFSPLSLFQAFPQLHIACGLKLVLVPAGLEILKHRDSILYCTCYSASYMACEKYLVSITTHGKKCSLFPPLSPSLTYPSDFFLVSLLLLSSPCPLLSLLSGYWAMHLVDSLCSMLTCPERLSGKCLQVEECILQMENRNYVVGFWGR